MLEWLFDCSVQWMSQWGSEGVSEWGSELLFNWMVNRSVEWVGEWVRVRVKEWVKEWVSEWVKEWVSERVGEWKSGWKGGWTSEWAREWILKRYASDENDLKLCQISSALKHRCHILWYKTIPPVAIYISYVFVCNSSKFCYIISDADGCRYVAMGPVFIDQPSGPNVGLCAQHVAWHTVT